VPWILIFVRSLIDFVFGPSTEFVLQDIPACLVLRQLRPCHF
jgi:hypothetical protein